MRKTDNMSEKQKPTVHLLEDLLDEEIKRQSERETERQRRDTNMKPTFYLLEKLIHLLKRDRDTNIKRERETVK